MAAKSPPRYGAGLGQEGNHSLRSAIRAGIQHTGLEDGRARSCPLLVEAESRSLSS